MAERRTMFECETCKKWFFPMEVFVRHPCAMNEANGCMESTSGVPAGASIAETIQLQKRDEEIISWTRDATLLLIEQYKTRQCNIDQGRLSKKRAYEQIAGELRKNGYLFSQEQCASRMKTIYRAYKNVKDSNAKSGNERKTYIFEKELDDLYLDKPNITPKFVESTASSSTPTTNEDQQDENPDPNAGTLKRKPSPSAEEQGIKRARKSQASEVLGFIKSQSMENEKRREESELRKQKRHDEKVDLFKQFLSIMEKK